MSSLTVLTTTPIKEIIFTISFADRIHSSQIESFTNLVDDKYSVRNFIETEIVTERPEKPSAENTNQQWILKCPEENKIINAKQGSLSFHKIKEYVHFNDLMEEFSRIWETFEKVVGHLKVTSLSVRYLNFINRDVDESDEDLVSIQIQHPFDEPLSTHIARIEFNYKSDPSVRANIICAKAKDGVQNGIILDIILNKKQSELADIEQLKAELLRMRAIKNDLFFTSITERTIKKYSHE